MAFCDRSLLSSLVLVLVGIGAHDVLASEESEGYDNPGLGDAPCVVLQSYQSQPGGNARFGALATIENICGRSVEVDFCFPYIEPVEDVDHPCVNGVIRPWATSTVEVDDLPARLAGPDYQWRYLR